MKFFTEKSLGYKIIIAIVIVVLFNFAAPTISSAGFGGILFEPIKDLLLVIADGIMSVSQHFLFDMEVSFITVAHPSEWVSTAGGIITGLLILAGGIALTVVTGGAFVVAGLIAGTVAGYYVSQSIEASLPKTFKLPSFILTPESMFSNSLSMLDVNFFNTEKENMVEATRVKVNEEGKEDTENGKEEWCIPISKSDDGEIIYKKVATEGKYTLTKMNTGEVVAQKSSALVLQPIVSKWYYALRNFAIVALLLILVYTAIRIIISSSAEDKAKYKQRLMDWLVAMCLLFFMHYIMAFAVSVTEEITKAVNSANLTYLMYIGDSAGEGEFKEYKYKDGDDEGKEIFSNDSQVSNALRESGVIQIRDDGTEVFLWPVSLMGKARVELQLLPQTMTEDDVAMRQFGYTVIYLALVIYTMLFLFRYLKRLLMLTFLTIIAPLMAMTYPLDKMRDGSAQGFNMWLKEYLFNLLIQPVHLILYTVLIGSAIDLVGENLLYALVALGFILQAEKLLRRFFGFDKASTVEGGSALGGALAMQGLNMVNKALGRGGKNGKGNGEKGQGKTKEKQLTRKADSGYGTDALFDNGQSGGQPALTSESTQGGATELTPEAQSWENYGNTGSFAGGTTGSGDTALTPEVQSWENYGNTGSFTGESESLISRAEQGWQEYAARGGTTTPSSTEAPHEGSAQLNTNANRTRKLTLANRVGMAARHYLPKAGRGLGNLVGNKLPRMALKGIMAGTGAMIGMTAGLVSDDFSNVAKWGAAGAGGGLLAGKGVVGVGDGLERKIKGLGSDIYETTHTDEEIKAHQNAKLDKAWQKDSSIIDKYQQGLGVSRDKAKKIMEKEAMEYRKHGITDDKMIIKAMKLEGYGELDSTARMQIADIASKVNGQKDMKDMEKSLVENRGFDKKIAKKYMDDVRRMKGDIV